MKKEVLIQASRQGATDTEVMRDVIFNVYQLRKHYKAGMQLLRKAVPGELPERRAVRTAIANALEGVRHDLFEVAMAAAAAKVPVVPEKPKAAKAKLEKKRSLHPDGCPCGFCRIKREEPHRDDCECKKCKDKRMKVAAKRWARKPRKKS
jgi:hypothetical protein